MKFTVKVKVHRPSIKFHTDKKKKRKREAAAVEGQRSCSDDTTTQKTVSTLPEQTGIVLELELVPSIPKDLFASLNGCLTCEF